MSTVKPYWGRRTTFFDPAFDAFMEKVEREEVRERWRGQLDFTDTVPSYWPACASGPCRQGRQDCPTPTACQIEEASNVHELHRLPVWVYLLVIGLAAGFSVFAPWGFGHG